MLGLEAGHLGPVLLPDGHAVDDKRHTYTRYVA